MSIYKAKVEIKGTRPLIFNCFTPECIPLERTEKKGVAGNNPEEWKRTFKTTNDGYLLVDGNYIHRCLINASKFTKRGLQPKLAATLETISESLIFYNRKLPELSDISSDPTNDVYIDIRGVKLSKNSSRHIRYRLATSINWETSFEILWESSIINKELMESICHDAGLFVGIGDNRVNGFGRFKVVDFKASLLEKYSSA